MLDIFEKNNKSLVSEDFVVSHLLTLINRELEFYFNNYAYIKDSLNISRLEGIYLMHIKENPYINQSKLAELLNTDITLISKMTKSLSDKQLIIQKASEVDKRQRILCLTDKSEKILAEFCQIYLDFYKLAFANFTDDETKILNKSLDKIFENLKFLKNKDDQTI